MRMRDKLRILARETAYMRSAEPDIAVNVIRRLHQGALENLIAARSTGDTIKASQWMNTRKATKSALRRAVECTRRALERKREKAI